MPLEVVNLTNGLVDNRFQIAASLAVRPKNDRFAEATTLLVNQFDWTSNVNATKETGEPNHANVGGGRSLWWRFRSQTNAGIIVHTCGSKIDTVLAVYTGSDVNALTTVAENVTSGLCVGKQSAVSFSAKGERTIILPWMASRVKTGEILLATEYGGALQGVVK